MILTPLFVLIFEDIPASERRAIKEARNSRLLQLLVIDLERENASLKKENKTLRARVDVLLDIMVRFWKIKSLTVKFCLKANSKKTFKPLKIVCLAFEPLLLNNFD